MIFILTDKIFKHLIIATFVLLYLSLFAFMSAIHTETDRDKNIGIVIGSLIFAPAAIMTVIITLTYMKQNLNKFGSRRRRRRY